MAHVALHTESRTGFEEAGPALNTHLTKPAQVLGCFLMQDDEAVLLEGNKKASAAFRTAMENALSGPSAAHPIEGYGSGSLSLAKVCKVSLVSGQLLLDSVNRLQKVRINL